MDIFSFFTPKAIFGIGLTPGQKFSTTLRQSAGLGILDVGIIGLQVKRAETGGVIPAIIGQSLALVPGLFIDASLALIPGIGPTAAMLLGHVFAPADFALGTWMAHNIRFLTDSNKKMRHLEMGGSYEDSELASRQRLIALQDMSSAMIPSRRYLGQEARLMHR